MQVVKRSIFALVAVAGMLLASVAFGGSASAYPPGVAPTIALSQSVAPDGATITVTGANFVPNEDVTLELHSAVSTVGNTTSSSTGTFSTAVRLTAGVEGQHSIVAIGASGDSASAAILITGSGTNNGSGNGSGSGTGGLSGTGVATLSIGGAGVVLLLGGALMLVAGRRRKATV